MTVKQLKVLLEKMPDNHPVFIQTWEPEYGTTNEEVLTVRQEINYILIKGE